ncbi:MAG: hypothetical protein IJT65_01295 [Eubacterium sp.]|nr:hypothetical protein [Eubacterium sp.]
MKNVKLILKWIFLSLLTLSVGFGAIAIPFKMLDLSGNAVRYFFIAEISVYFVFSMLFLVRQQKERERKAKEKRLRLERRKRFEKAQEEYYSLAA